jgi:preprotein translocase subunit SecE
MGILKNIGKFLSEVRAEMQKVTWSTREELMGSTGVVLMTMLILSTFIGISDFIMSHALSIILR